MRQKKEKEKVEKVKRGEKKRKVEKALPLKISKQAMLSFCSILF